MAVKGVFRENGNDPMVGVTLPRRYRILSLLDKRDYVIKYLGTYEPVDQKVVIYLFDLDLSNDEQAFKRFQQAAKRLVNLEHANIASVLDFGHTTSGRPYLITEQVSGQSLAEVLQEAGIFSARYAMRFLLPVAAALAGAHAHGIVHEGLLLNEIVFSEDSDKGDVVKVGGFSIISTLSQVLEKPLTPEQQLKIIGTARYMSPEQCLGKALDKRSDLYSFGCILYQCLTGQPPFNEESGQAHQVLQRRAKEPLPELAKICADLKIPADIVAVIKKCTAKDPQRRYQSMQEVALALGADSALVISQFRADLPASNTATAPIDMPVTGSGPLGSDSAAAYSASSATPSLVPTRSAVGRRGYKQAEKKSSLPVAWLVTGAVCLLAGIAAWAAFFVLPQWVPSGLPVHSAFTEVEQLIVQGKFDTALLAIAKAKNKAQAAKDDILLSRLIEQECVILLTQGCLLEAQDVVQPLGGNLQGEAKTRKLLSEARVSLAKKGGTRAVELAQAAFKYMDDLSGSNSLLLIDVLGVLSLAQSAAGDIGTAAATLKQADQVLQAAHPSSSLLEFQYKLAETQYRLARQEYPKAEQLANITLGFAQERFGVGHPFAIVGMLVLADVLQAAEKPQEAESVLSNALVLAQKLTEKPWPLVGVVATRLALLQESMQKYAEAEKHYRMALAVAEGNWGENSPRVIPATENLARYLRARKNIKGASAYELHLQLLTGKRKW